MQRSRKLEQVPHRLGRMLCLSRTSSHAVNDYNSLRRLILDESYFVLEACDNSRMAFFTTLFNQSIFSAAALFLLYPISLAVYRLYFSPLAKFPGNTLAILTLWYEFYYQVFKGGKYVWEIEKMHQKYGELASLST